MIGQLDTLFTTLTNDLGVTWIVLAALLIAFMIVMALTLKEPAIAFVFTLIPMSLLIIGGFLQDAMIGYVLIIVSIFGTIAFAKVFIK